MVEKGVGEGIVDIYIYIYILSYIYISITIYFKHDFYYNTVYQSPLYNIVLKKSYLKNFRGGVRPVRPL